MPSSPDATATLQALTDALAADDFEAARALLTEQDQRAREFAALAAGQDALRPQLIEWQRLQVDLIDLLRKHQCATIDALQALDRGSKATRAYRAESEP